MKNKYIFNWRIPVMVFFATVCAKYAYGQQLNPTHASSITASGALLNTPYVIRTSGNYAYVVSTGSNALEILDIRNPNTPLHKGSIVHGAGGASILFPNDVFVAGDYAYIVDNTGYLEIVDISNPGAPVHAGKTNRALSGAVMSGPRSVSVAGNFAFVANTGANAIEIFNISNPAAPFAAASISDGQGGALLGAPMSLYTSPQGYVYVASNSSNALEIIDARNPVLPSHVGSIVDGNGASLSQPSGLYVLDNYAYVVGGSSALEIVDVGNPAMPVHAGSIAHSTDAWLFNATSVFVSGGYAYVTCPNLNSLEIVNVSDPANPTHTGKIVNGGETQLSGARSVSVAGNYAFVAGYLSGVIEVINISTPSTPVHQSYVGSGGGGIPMTHPDAVAISGNHAFVLGKTAHTLVSIDITDPQAPVYSGSIASGTNGALLTFPTSIAISGDYAYITSSDADALEIVDIHNPSAMVHKASISNGMNGALLDDPEAVFVKDGYAYIVSTASNALEIVDIRNPGTPIHAGRIVNGTNGAMLNSPKSVFVSDGYAFVASSGSNALEIIDVSDPTNPVHRSAVTNGQGGAFLNSPDVVIVYQNYAYVTSYISGSGIEIIDVSDPATPFHRARVPDGYNGAALNLPSAMYVSGKFLYIVDSNPSSGALEIMDLSNPTNPQHRGKILNRAGGALLAEANAVSVSGTYTFVTSPDDNALEIIFTKLPQAIPDLGIDNHYEIGSADVTLPAVTDGNQTITYTSSDENVIQIINGNTIHFVGLGRSTIVASQAGNANYFEADAVLFSITVTKLLQTITFDPIPTKQFGSGTFELNATASTGLPITYTSDNTDVATISGNVVTMVSVGTVGIYASQAGDDTYEEALAYQTLDVTPGDQTITFSAIPPVKYGTTFDFGATTTSGLDITYSSSDPAIATVNGRTVTLTGIGSCQITAHQAGNANYNAAADVQQTLTVVKGDQTITFSVLPTDKKITSAPFELTATVSSGLPISYSSSNTAVATINGNTVTIVGAGTTTITASQPGNANYNAAAAVQQTLTVSIKQDQTITFNALPTDKKVGSAPFDLTATATSGLPVSYTSSNTAVATINGSTVTIVGGGTTIITASQPGNANYNAAPAVQQTLTIIVKQDQTIVFAALPAKAEGDHPFQLSASSSAQLPITFTIVSGPATISGNTITLTGAGRVTVKASQAGNDNYNAAADVTQNFCVNPAKPVITASFIDPSVPVLTSSSAQGNQWYLNGVSISGATAHTYTVNDAGSYTVGVTIDGCVGPLSDPSSTVVTGIEHIGEISLQIFPNPASEALQISFAKPAEYVSVVLMDASGRSVLTGGKELLNTNLNVGHYAPGLYIVHLQANKQIYTSKFLKK